jgi:hypothetical protein
MKARFSSMQQSWSPCFDLGDLLLQLFDVNAVMCPHILISKQVKDFCPLTVMSTAKGEAIVFAI